MGKGSKDNEAAQRWGTASVWRITGEMETPGAGKEPPGRGDVTEHYRIFSGTERENWGSSSLSPSGHNLGGNEWM